MVPCVFFQDAKENKRLKMVQFEEIAGKIAREGQEGRELLEESNRIKEQMSQFEGLFTEKRVCIELRCLYGLGR